MRGTRVAAMEEEELLRASDVDLDVDDDDEDDDNARITRPPPHPTSPSRP